ncbi:DUF5009 domain-containing protein [Segetibacter sp. 3557_3]|uniref:DUF5009 domain-containing protein n=1 Tax=Segetibacter sp. 3557_3 TaxID=2547429 RepID=UPI001A9DE216|nr:DUF5009 domain-containing protein [Segetibacter sp. 3557_3]
MKARAESLDALRGFAILAMVLSGSIAYGGVLPAWMYHAQVPPPLHKFIPSLPGITWVDLVFPFFLFSMGAAIPLSLARLERTGTGAGKMLWIATRRYLLLTFFALFTQHMKAWVIAKEPGTTEQLISILGFLLLFFQFYEYKGDRYRNLFLGVKISAVVLAVFLLYKLPFASGRGFQLNTVDIIVLVLANMAFFGTIAWWVNKKFTCFKNGIIAVCDGRFFGQHRNRKLERKPV